MKKENSLWCEKYRPKILDNFVGNDHVKTKIKQYIEQNDPPHLLFAGKPGVGKSSISYIIANNTKSDVMYINASDENSVDVVRNKIKGFASTISFENLKIIICDEFDFFSPNAQAALRHLMEVHSKTTRFILTANYHEKIIDPIISRCQVFHIIPPSRKDIALYLVNILQKEKVAFQASDIKLLVDATYPDIRQLLNKSQKSSLNGTLQIDREEIIGSDFNLKLLEMITNSDVKNAFKKIRQFVADNHRNDFIDTYHFLYDKIDEISPSNISGCIMVIADGIKWDSLIVDKEIGFMATIIKLLFEKNK